MDARLPVRFGPLHSRRPDEAVLTDAIPSGPGAWVSIPAAPTAHPAGCDCCPPRSAAATTLGTLFRARATRPGTPFRTVLAAVDPGNEAAIRAALAADPVVSARFRLGS